MSVLALTHARDILGITGGLGALCAVLAAVIGGPIVGAAVATAGWAFFFPLVAQYQATSIVTLPIWVMAGALTGLLADRLRAADDERTRLVTDLEREAMTRDFVMTASHELRTPLAAISGAALTLANRRLEVPERERMLDLVIDQSRRLARVLDDLLSASKLDGGLLNMALEPCRPLPIAREVVAAAQASAPAGLTVELSAVETIPDVVADRDKLRQVLANLVDNAVKYSPEGGQVTVALGPGRDGLRFAVCDRGLGIPASEHRRIFQKFYRLDPAMTRGIGGTGLGLYIVGELVRRMGGTIDLISSEGTGSTFWFELPLAPEEIQSDPADEPLAAERRPTARALLTRCVRRPLLGAARAVAGSVGDYAKPARPTVGITSR